jgi:S-(hydroxymethyl)glutathione dehydrogenase/alcohol dehydrogenase
MRGLLYEGVGKLRVEDKLEVLDPADDEIEVKIVASGLCHSDVSVWNGTIAWAAPSVLGHEGAGIVTKVGKGVKTLSEGDKVALHTLQACGACAHCGSGKPTHCRKTIGNRSSPFRLHGEPVGNFAGTSTFVERTVVKGGQAVKIGDDVPLDIACVVGCGVLTGVGAALNRANVEPGQSCAVFGIGGIGLNVIQGLRLAGAGRIIAVDVLASREAMAREFGATDFVSAAGGDAVAQIKAMLPEPGAFESGGVDWSFECSGNSRALADSVNCLNWGGNCVVVGTPPAGAKLGAEVLTLGLVDRGVMGVRYGSAQPHHDIPRYLGLAAQGKLNIAGLVTKRYALEDFETAMHELEEGKLARGVFLL